MSVEAASIIAALGLRRHPEGGWYAETFRDNATTGGRGHSSAIYYLLQAGEVSAWHRVKDAAEVWHFYAGAPLEVTLAEDRGEMQSRVLGVDFDVGEQPQVVVPPGWWQTARTLGDWTLAGCTVAPGFEFSAFELASPGWQPTRVRER